MFGHWNLQCNTMDNATAFTYKVWFPNSGMRYIGVKTMKGKWKQYTSSCKTLNKLLSEGHAAIFTIVEFFETYKDAHNAEQDALRAYTVLQRDEYLNANIGGTVGFTDEVRKRMSEKGKGKIVSEETRAKLSAINKGRVFSEEHRKNLSESCLARNARWTEEQWKVANEKRSNTLKGKPWLGTWNGTPEELKRARTGCKLSFEDVYNIRFVETGTLAELAAKYNVSKPTVCRVKGYKVFPEITESWKQEQEDKHGAQELPIQTKDV